MYHVIFYILAAAAVISVLMLITRADHVASALWLLVCMLSIGGLFALLSAPFLSVVQLIISAGSVVLLFLFLVITMIEFASLKRRRAIRFGRAMGAISAAYLAIVLALSILKPPFLSQPATGESFGAVSTFGRIFVSKYVVPFELVGILFLMVVVVTTVLVGRKT